MLLFFVVILLLVIIIVLVVIIIDILILKVLLLLRCTGRDEKMTTIFLFFTLLCLADILKSYADVHE